MQRWTRRTYLERLLAERRAQDEEATLHLRVDGRELEVEEIHADFLLARPFGGGPLAMHPIDGVIVLPDHPSVGKKEKRFAS
jgi:hypothetical protein